MSRWVWPRGNAVVIADEALLQVVTVDGLEPYTGPLALTITTPEGDEIEGATWPVTIEPVDDSPGRYFGIVPALDPEATRGKAIFVGSSPGARWVYDLRFEERS